MDLPNYRLPLAAPSALRGEAAQNPSAKVARCLERLQTSPKGKHGKTHKTYSIKTSKDQDLNSF